MLQGFSYFFVTCLLSRWFVGGADVAGLGAQLQGIGSDVGLSLLLALVCTQLRLHRLSRPLIYLIVLLWFLYCGANVEMVLALDKPLLLTELGAGMNAGFIANSVQHLASMWYLLLTALLSIWVCIAYRRPLAQGSAWSRLLALAIAVVLLAVCWSGEWRKSHALVIAFDQALLQAQIGERLSSGSRHGVVPGLERVDQSTLPSRLRAGVGRTNVLIVVLEGISGGYLPSLARRIPMVSAATMPALDALGQQGMTLTNFVAHGHQTIRGLYAMLCGDYNKLSNSEFKSTQYLRLPVSQRKACLPELLQSEGYHTVFAQAADLGYMGKDTFMPAIGFERVLGKPDFPRTYVEHSWGPDDRAFLEQSVDLVEQLQSEQRPWFLTLLTVGTHHPYAIPDRSGLNVTEQRLAAIRYLDQAVADFWAQLDRRGLLHNTLVIFTSDETQGVPGHPLTRNWGFFTAVGPAIPAQLNHEVRGQVDVAVSVLDYLSLDSVRHATGYSIFRQLDQARPLLFSGLIELLYVDAVGSLTTCRGRSECSRWPLSERGLFAEPSQRSALQGDELTRTGQMLERYRETSDNSLR